MTRLAFTALIPSLLALGASSQSPSTFFEELTIDSSLHLILTRGIDLPYDQEPAVGSYYAPFHGAFVTSVDHREKKLGADARERSLYLETGQDQILDRTVKHDEILNGPFGSVDLKRECFYTRSIQNGAGSVSLEFNGNGTEHELPSEVSSPREGLPPLTSLSLVRIFRKGPQYLIISANYERDGRLGSLNTQGGTSMYWTGNPQADALERELDPTLKEYGIPTQINVQGYLRSRRVPLPPVAIAQEKNVMHEIYGFGKFIRQDELKDGAIVSSRWLQPSMTKEEKETLNPLCDARFLQQQAIGLPTVE